MAEIGAASMSPEGEDPEDKLYFHRSRRWVADQRGDLALVVCLDGDSLFKVIVAASPALPARGPR